jgi:exopolysaccharide biosynthesis polyprenyl glycosylphosphotransferase
MSALVVFGVYKSRFRSSWELFKRVFSGVFLGTLLSVAFVYVFRAKWGAFPTSVFIISFFVNLLLIFKLNQLVLKAKKRIKKKVIVIGDGEIDDMPLKKAFVERLKIDEIEELTKHMDTDEIIICDKIQDGKNLNLLIYLLQKLKIDVVFSPSIYMKLLPEKINSDNSIHLLSTFIGEKRDMEEFMIRSLDVIGSVFILLIFLPVMFLISLLIKISSPGPVLYKQQRVGKDGKTFTLFKFRTMINDAEKQLGPVLAVENDPRVTKVGRFLRDTRLDEIPQLLNVILGQMSLVGPRPERPHFVKLHKSLRELRLAVKPGLTGLAQIRSFYDLQPKHKIKYDYLYIQRRSLLLNLYILAKTVPIIFSKKGW